MLESYHLFFTIASIVLFFLGVLFIFIWNKKYENSQFVGVVILFVNIVFCWVSRLGFHGIQFIDLDSTDTFQVYTYPEMWSLNVIPYGIILVSFAVIIVASLMQFGIMFKEAESDNKEIRLPTSDRAYWKKKGSRR